MESIQKSQAYTLKYFTEHHKLAKTFEVGDLVVLRNVDTTIGTDKKCIVNCKKNNVKIDML